MNPLIQTKRLSRDTNYKSSDKTYQSTLSKEDIAKKLEDYVRVESNKVITLPLNTHLRYFTINPKTGEKSFRLGGYLTKVGDNNEYVILSNNQLSWSVQLSNSLFYKKLTQNEFKNHIQSEVEEDFKSQMEQLIKENKELKKIIKQIKVTTENSKKSKEKK